MLEKKATFAFRLKWDSHKGNMVCDLIGNKPSYSLDLIILNIACMSILLSPPHLTNASRPCFQPHVSSPSSPHSQTPSIVHTKKIFPLSSSRSTSPYCNAPASTPCMASPTLTSPGRKPPLPISTIPSSSPSQPTTKISSAFQWNILTHTLLICG